MCRVDYGDGWLAFHSNTRKARKPHTCYECTRRIQPGEHYHYAAGRSNDAHRFDEYHVCAHCEAAGEWLRVMCGGWCYGGILEELVEHWQEEWSTRSMGLLVLIVRMGNRWVDRHDPGQLVAPPAYAKTVAEATMKQNKLVAA